MIKKGVSQLSKFAVVGCINTFIDWIVYLAVLKAFPAESTFFYTIAKSFSYFCGIINSFYLNNYWTFKTKSDENVGDKFAKFVLVNLAGLCINSASIYIILNLKNLKLVHPMALFLSAFITFTTSFTLNKLWVFRRGKMVERTTGG